MLALQRRAGNRAALAALGMHARRDERTDAPRARTAMAPGLAGAVGGHAARLSVQRSLFDDLWESVSDAAESIKDAATTFVKRAQQKMEEREALREIYPELGPWWAPRPDLDAVLENPGLETIRHKKKQMLAVGKVPDGGDQGATRVVKQAVRAWGAEVIGVDLLPVAKDTGDFDAEMKMAVEHFQFFNDLNPDGRLGPATLSTLDEWLGVRIAPDVPRDVGGTAERGLSNWDPTRNPIGRIYFETDGISLGERERAVLEQIAFEISAPVRRVKNLEIQVVGYADKREDAEYNEELADWRATAVSDYLEKLIDDLGIDAKLTKEVHGEKERPQPGDTSAELKPYRRVDLHFPWVEYRPPPKDLTHDCGEKTRDWEVQTRNLATMGEGYVTTTALVDFRMAKPDSKGRRWKMTYRYGGAGAGIGAPYTGPAGYDPSNDWEKFRTSKPLGIWQFGGKASISSVGAVVGKGYSHDVLWLYGIEKHGAAPKKIVFSGPSTGWGVGVNKDLLGRLTPHTDCEEEY